MTRSVINTVLAILAATRSLINTALAILAVMVLASCGEKESRSDPEGPRAYNNETPQHPAYERTVEQGESERMGN